MNRSDEAQASQPIEPAGFSPLDSADTAPAGNAGHRGRIIVAALLAVFLAVMLFLFNARSLQVDVITETAADVSLSGFALPFGERFLLLPGAYEIEARAEGYVPLASTVTVDERDSQSIELVLQPLPGRLSVQSVPAGATVTIDGEALGVTPLQDVALSAGTHEILLQEARHQSLRQTLEITGRNVEQQLKIELQPAWADVAVASLPAGAEVFVDGEPAGKTPIKLELLEGERELSLSLPGYATYKQGLKIVAGGDVDLGEIALAPAAGSLMLDSVPTGANVTLNGEFQGKTPLTLKLDPEQEHRLSLSKPGYHRSTETLTLDAADVNERRVELRPQLGKIRFVVIPETATLRINGEPRGSGSRTLSLPALQHRVEVSLPGYATQRRQITSRPGLEQVARFELQTEQDALLARSPPERKTQQGQLLKLFRPTASELSQFEMGASRRDPGRRSNEVLRPVALKRMFYLAATEVTNAQFRQFQADHDSGQVQGRSLNREKQPAVQLSWQQAASYCNWLSRREGLPPFYRENRGIITGYNPASTGYRLPTEAEWAWAARTKGEALLKFPWGESFPPAKKIENYADKSSAFITGRVLNNYDDGFVVTAPVASFSPNQHGLYDMGGNVAEWVHDVYGIPESNGPVQTDPMGAQTGDNYVVRGASWSMAKLPQLRLSYRDYGQAGRDDVGFRIARYAE